MRTRDDEIRIAEAEFPKPFLNGLEFNAPVHGTWNIVHIGLQMPGAVQVYVCARNCMRGVILTAAEMLESGRFSFVILDEKDLALNNIDQATIDGVSDLIEKRTKAGCRPRAIQLFTVCVHHFLGTDYKKLYETLDARFPDIDFYRCYMDPVMQKKGYTADQKLRRAMYEKLPQCEPEPRTVAVLGNDFPLDDSADLVRQLRAGGFELLQARTCRTYEQFLQLSRAALFIATYPPAKLGVEAAARRLGRAFLYLPGGFDETLIGTQRQALADYMRSAAAQSASPVNGETAAAAETPVTHEAVIAAARSLREKLGDTPIFLDATVHPHVLSLARLLLENGMHVKKIFLDAMSPEEAQDFAWLQANAPEVVLSAITHMKKRRYVTALLNSQALAESGGEEAQKKPPLEKLAVGQMAAYLEQTPYFVNMVAGFGLHGRDGMLRMLAMMAEAADAPKDLEDVVPRKGLGCESCI